MLPVYISKMWCHHNLPGPAPDGYPPNQVRSRLNASCCPEQEFDQHRADVENLVAERMTRAWVFCITVCHVIRTIRCQNHHQTRYFIVMEKAVNYSLLFSYVSKTIQLIFSDYSMILKEKGYAYSFANQLSWGRREYNQGEQENSSAADEKVYDCFCRAFLSQTSPQDIDDSDKPDGSRARESESDGDNELLATCKQRFQLFVFQRVLPLSQNVT